MIQAFLRSLEANPTRLQNVKMLFQRYLTGEEDFMELQNQVFQEIQSGKTADYYPELLAWAFVQSKNYKAALRQLKALDRRNNENGRRVYNLAQTAENDDKYEVAIDAYNYILEEKGSSSPYFFAAQQQVLDCRLDQLTKGYAYSQEEVKALFNDYESFLDSMGRTGRTASIMADQARLAAIYLNDMDEAIKILENLIEAPGINELIKARAKLKLGDYYLVQGKKWDATLLYAQVDKAFPEAEIGEEARFKNAMLSYYTGDFEWAQEQFDILKAATSRLIANDAIDRSVFIMDNLNLDTIAHPLELYADAELLVFQNNFDPAFNKLDSIQNLYPEHGLLDDILYLKGRIALKRNKYEKARDYYAKIVTEYPEEIRADNALFKWAQLEQEQFNNMEEAQRLYEKLFLEYANSTLASEARKRYRILRGDNIQ
jgi:TolA-binding protein